MSRSRHEDTEWSHVREILGEMLASSPGQRQWLLEWGDLGIAPDEVAHRASLAARKSPERAETADSGGRELEQLPVERPVRLLPAARAPQAHADQTQGGLPRTIGRTQFVPSGAATQAHLELAASTGKAGTGNASTSESVALRPDMLVMESAFGTVEVALRRRGRDLVAEALTAPSEALVLRLSFGSGHEEVATSLGEMAAMPGTVITLGPIIRFLGRNSQMKGTFYIDVTWK